MNKIISVTPTEKEVSLTWMLGSRCNYDCMYCPTELHDSTSAIPELSTLCQIWDKFYHNTRQLNLPYKISFTGGEVTANKNFLPLLEYIKTTAKAKVKILFTTNGSAGLEYYKRACDLVDSISFSSHSEFFDEQKFFDKAVAINHLLVRPEKSFHVNVMDEWWIQDRIKLYTEFLTKHDISYSVNHVNYSAQIRNIPIKQGVYNLDA